MISFTQNNIFRFAIAVSTVLLIARQAAAEQWTVVSPNGSLSVTIVQAKPGDPNGNEKNLYCRVDLDKREVLPPAPLGVTMQGKQGDFTNRLTFVSQTHRVIDETYPMPYGKKSMHRNHACEKTLVFKNSHGQTMHLIVRAYDDGAAYRYHFPGDGQRQIVEEASGFRFPEGSTGWMQPLFLTYERDYFEKPIGRKPGLDVRVQRVGGVNAVVSKIELWSTEKPPLPVHRIKAHNDPGPPAGYYLVATDNCDGQGFESRCAAGTRYTLDDEKVPLAVVPAKDPARTATYDKEAVVYRFLGISSTARYKLRTVHLSDDDARRVGISANGHALGEVAIPKQKVMAREFDVPRAALKKLPMPTDGAYAFPALFKTPGDAWVLLTEAAVYGDYAGSHLIGPSDLAGVWRVNLCETVSSSLPWTTPWRVAIVGGSLGTIVESVIVDNLNPPCEVKDTSWIQPGRVTFPWMADRKANGKFEKLKTFVDRAAEMGWEWIEFDTAYVPGGWQTIPWVPELVAYAREKGVSVYGWDRWTALDTPEERERIFSLYKKFGITGVKVDFLDSDSQARFKFRDEIIRDCMQRKLMVSFHGATIPRGQRRRWPHVLTWEGVMGGEHYGIRPQVNLGLGAWQCHAQDMQPNPAYNCTLPFARNVVGPMDAHPMAFTQLTDVTEAQELALSVIFESGWECLSDSPEAYATWPGTPFLRHVPAAWDDTHFIAGYPGELVCLARRKDNDWYLAAICGRHARTVSVPLDFLKPGDYEVTVYRNSADGKQIAVEQVTLESDTPLEITLPAGGGFCTRIADSSP